MKALSSLMLLTLIWGCTHAPTNQEMADFNNMVKEKETHTARSVGRSADVRTPLRAGQWVTILSTYKNSSDKSISTYKVIKVDGRNVIMEVESMNASAPQPSITQFEIHNYPLNPPLSATKEEVAKTLNKIEITKITVKSGKETPKEIPVTLMPLAKDTIKDALASGYRTSEVHREGCSSQFIKASSCLVYDFEADGFGHSMKGKTFTHSKVPIMGFVKSETDKADTTVINYGMTGAKTSL